MGFLFRWLFAFGLLSLTFNPTEWNYVRWAEANWRNDMPLAIFSGLVLLVGYIIYLRATLRSIGLFGMLLVLGVVGSALWLAYDRGWLELDDTVANIWIGIFALSIVLGTGLSWSLIRRRLSGQLDVDDVEE
ncbi:MAG: hypothetical protein D6811_10105 [Alphaproteobacteria bacterium]|nr:MAG: hypothetical protein D6811_10105 [Alphaproteobacteria bacterium]